MIRASTKLFQKVKRIWRLWEGKKSMEKKVRRRDFDMCKRNWGKKRNFYWKHSFALRRMLKYSLFSSPQNLWQSLHDSQAYLALESIF